MVVDNGFRQVEKIMEAMEITYDATKIKLATFQLQGESQMWWDMIKDLRDLEAITWASISQHQLNMQRLGSSWN